MSREEILKKLETIFQDIFDDESLTLNESTSTDDVDDWDSLAQISLIAAIEAEFGIRFNIKTALTLHSVSAIISAVEECLGTH